MDRYHLWCDLRDGTEDLAFADAVAAYLDHLQGEGLVESWRLGRRKLGLGPQELGEWHVEVCTRDLAQLDEAFEKAARRAGATDRLHAAVWSKVTGLRTALYRDFPDDVRRGD